MFNFPISNNKFISLSCKSIGRGTQVKLWFLSLPSEDIAISRVAERVVQGGHNIPEQIIRRRFKSGLENFHERYCKVVDSWALYDNYLRPPKLIDWIKK